MVSAGPAASGTASRTRSRTAANTSRRRSALRMRPIRDGRYAEAETIRRQLMEQFGKYTDLADIFPRPANKAGRDRQGS